MERSGRREYWCGLLLVLVVVLGLNQTKLWRPGLVNNVQITEAKAWWNGDLDLPEREWDTALKDGRVYNCFPPMFTIIAAGFVPVFGGVPHWLIVALVAGVPLCAYVLLHRLTRSPVWGAVLAIGYVCGTSAWPVLNTTVRNAAPYHVNHTLATIGLFVFLIEYSGRRRVWLGGIGLIIASLSRQLTVFYALPLALMAWRGGAVEHRAKRLTAFAVVGLVVVMVPAVMNTLKFGHPLDSGYMHIYADRSEDWLSRDATRYGLFSAHYVPRNLYYANLGFPRVYSIEIAGKPEIHLRPNRMGTGIWWTTPLLLWVVVDLRRILKERSTRDLLIAVVVVGAGLMFFHNTGYDQRGFNRFSLDYVPVLLALVAPRCFVGWRRWISLPMIVWSVVYFRCLI